MPNSPNSPNPPPAPKTPLPRSTITLTSTCLCHSIQIQATGEDKNAVLCHCDNCRQTSGSAFMHNHRLMKSRITVLRGADKLRVYEDGATKSGNRLRRHFCGGGGSPLWLTNSAVKGFAALAVGNLEGEKRAPFMELFKEEKQAWIGDVTKTTTTSKV